jgi:segregation and condensation protein B
MEIDIAVNEAAPSDRAGSPENGGDAGAGGVEQPERIKLGPGEAKPDELLLRELCAVLFAATEPLPQARLVELLERPAPARVQAALERLQAELEASVLPVVLRKIAGAWRLLTEPELGPVVARLETEPKPERISAAALETLAIIAYRQPVSKAEIEAIRGVQAGPVLRSLVDRGLVRITGRAELPGQPLLYGTTKEFLERFGLAGLKELPRDGELNED